MPRITVRLYSILRQRGGRTINQLELELPPHSTVSDALRALEVPNRLDILLTLNGTQVEPDAVLSEEDDLALIPAVAGG